MRAKAVLKEQTAGWGVRLRVLAGACLAVGLLAGCANTASMTSPRTLPAARELVFYDWSGDMPQSVIDAFTKETGVTVLYRSYASQEDAINDIRNGHAFDVVVMESRFIPMLVKAGLLKKLDHRHIPNLKNLSASFRDLDYDPGNAWSVPYAWGTTGLVVRTDLAAAPVTSWADLWDKRYEGRTGLWLGQVREVIGLTLKSLGYSANSTRPAELQQALQKLVALKPHMLTLETFDPRDSADLMVSGRAVVTMGSGADALEGRKKSPAVAYVLPSEGALLWAETFVIPITSRNADAAQDFLNFLMRPEVNARIADENEHATPNEAAWAYLDPAILNDPIVFPPNASLAKAELILPLDDAGQRLDDAMWKEFIASPARP